MIGAIQVLISPSGIIFQESTFHFQMIGAIQVLISPSGIIFQESTFYFQMIGAIQVLRIHLLLLSPKRAPSIFR
jgi:hypothetical protein